MTIDSEKDQFVIKDTIKVDKEESLVCFSCPFDKLAIDFLEDGLVPAYKIISFEITYIPLMKYVASKGKSIISSTGIAEIEDIELALVICRKAGNNQITLLKRTSDYSTPIVEANVCLVKDLAK